MKVNEDLRQYDDSRKKKKKKKSKWPLAIALILLVYLGMRSIASSQRGDSPSGSYTPAASSTPSYEEEITFNNYPWGTSVVEVSNNTGNQYFESMTPDWSDAYTVSAISNYVLGYQIYGIGDYSAGGYTTRNLKMFFSYGHKNGKISTAPDDSELYLVIMDFDVADIGGTYDDLYSKLTSIYGEGKTTEKTTNSVSTDAGYYKTAVTITEWRGQNNTGVMLTKSIPNSDSSTADLFHNFVSLSYGKTDSAQMLKSLYSEYKDMEAANEAANRDPDNKQGL